MSVIVRDVSKRMGKNDVLRNVSIEVDPGTVVGLQGINGSGKTMLMRAVCGLIKSTEGEISIDGQRLGVDISFPPSLGMLIEAPSFLGYLSTIIWSSSLRSRALPPPRTFALPCGSWGSMQTKKRSSEHTRLG